MKLTTSKTDITRSDTALLKGVAILAIVLHNFCHWIPGAVVENEYNFYFSHSVDLLVTLRDLGPHVVLNLFSYFGCYGVPVFLLISGYGMVRKYEREGAAGIGVREFTLYNARKLWRLMLVGFALLFLYEELFTTGWRHGFLNIIWFFTFLSNFLPQTDTAFLPKQDLLLGPWWYFSLTMQMYLLYRLAFYRRGRGALIAAAAVCVALQVASLTVLYEPSQTMLHYLRYTFLGCLLPFALGVWAARYGLPKSPILYIACLAVFVAAIFNVFAWVFAPLALALLALPLTRLRATRLRSALEWLGKISAWLFVVHPIVRAVVNPRMGGNVYLMLAEYLALSIALAWVLTKLMTKNNTAGNGK